MSLKAAATSRCSLDPSGSARASRSPPATRRAVRASARSGFASEPARSQATPSPRASAANPTAISASTSLRTSFCTASTLWVTRTAPTVRPARSTGTAVNRTSSPSVSLWRVPWPARPRSAAATSGRLAYEASSRPSPAESAISRPRRSTTITRPPRSVSALARTRRSSRSSPSRPDTVEAISDAWPWASLFTSASTRFERLSASGTSSATITSTST